MLIRDGHAELVEGVTGGAREVECQAFDCAMLKQQYRKAGRRGAQMVNKGCDKATAERAQASGADLVAFGRPLIDNRGLLRRFKKDAPLKPTDGATLYGGSAKGDTDDPALT